MCCCSMPLTLFSEPSEKKKGIKRRNGFSSPLSSVDVMFSVLVYAILCYYYYPLICGDDDGDFNGDSDEVS